MRVFVVVSATMGGEQFVRVLRVRPDAGPGETVLEVNVVGVQTDPDVVYVAQTLDRTMDILNFEGVYGDYESTLGPRGPNGSTLSVRI